MRKRQWQKDLHGLREADLILCVDTRWQKICYRYDHLVRMRTVGVFTFGSVPMELVESHAALAQRFLEESLSGKNVKVL